MLAVTETEVYIHIPFCARKCAYCDFLSAPADSAEQRQYVDMLLEEIRGTWLSVPVCTVFIGGGTPSVLPAEWIAEILGVLRECYTVREDAEITIEANPGTVDAEKLRLYREAGINRISFGCQSFRDGELRLLGRIHTREDILKSVALAREAGFTNINLDLISGIPGQTLEDWEDDLRQAAALEPEHISAYSLILEEGTPLYERYNGSEENGPPLPDEETERRMYDRTREVLAEYGFRRYEISNYAKEGRTCRHNIGYWTGVPYAGFGLGAASFLPSSIVQYGWETNEEDAYRDEMMAYDDGMTGYADELPEEGAEESGEPKWLRYSNTDRMLAYSAGVYEHVGLQVLKQKDLEAEFMILGLRMTDGVEDAEFERRFGRPLDLIYGRILEKYEKQGLLIRKDGRTRLSERGLSVSNPIMADFL